jgi:predicted nucleic acid-binding protein
MIVVDTNVVSELIRPQPAPSVIGWVRQHGTFALHTTAITVAEIRYGIERLTDGRRKDQLSEAAVEVFSAFAEQVLPFDARAALEYAAVVCDRDRVGLPIDGFDAQIAAICRAHRAALATRNTKDFRDVGVDIIDPWRYAR